MNTSSTKRVKSFLKECNFKKGELSNFVKNIEKDSFFEKLFLTKPLTRDSINFNV